MSERAYKSIGEVLVLLQDDFPDITVSKIRFLESQGLLDPERTPSGYRKFYDDDIARLRFILRAQRDRFLPLKVIKDLLDEAGGGVPPDDAEVPADATHELAGEHAPGDRDDEAAHDAAEAPAEGPVAPVAETAATTPTPAPAPVPPPAPEPAPLRPAGDGRIRAGAAPATTPAAPGGAGSSRVELPDTTGGSSGGLSAEEVAAATGLSVEEFGELERFRLVRGRSVGRIAYYEDDAVAVARLAKAFLDHGIEPRHLRMYRHAAEREAGLFEQVVAPLVRQRNPEARKAARDTLVELAALGESFRAAMMALALSEYLEQS